MTDALDPDEFAYEVFDWTGKPFAGEPIEQQGFAGEPIECLYWADMPIGGEQ